MAGVETIIVDDALYQRILGVAGAGYFKEQPDRRGDGQWDLPLDQFTYDHLQANAGEGESTLAVIERLVASTGRYRG